MANELQLAAGLKLTNPAPADAYYCKPQVGQAPAQPYSSAAEACDFVAEPLRYGGLTVNVANVEMWWLSDDLSDFGLVVKAPSSPPTPGTGGGATYTTFSFDVAQDGAASYDLPTGTVSVAHPLQVQQVSAYPQRPVRTILPTHYRLSGVTLLISEDAGLLEGDTVVGSATSSTGGTPGTPGRDNNNVAQAVRDAVTDPSHTWEYGDLTAYGTSDLETAALDGVVKGDYFDAFEQNSTVDAYRYCYCLQNSGLLGWTRLLKYN